MFFTRKYLYVLVSQWETGFYYYALGCTCSWDTTPQTHLSLHPRRIENDFTPSLIYLLYLVLLSRGRSACLNNCLSSELPDHSWPEMSAGTVRVHLTCLWLRSTASCQRRNAAKYVKNGRILHMERQTKETENQTTFTICCQQRSYQKGFCRICTDAKCLLDVIQHRQMKQLDMIVVWSDAGECFKMHSASVCAWCFNAFLRCWEVHGSSRTPLLVVTTSLIALRRSRLLFSSVIGITSDSFQRSHWDNAPG